MERIHAAGWAVDVGADGYEAVALNGGSPPAVLARVTFAADGSPLVEAASEAPASLRHAALADARRTVLAWAGRLAGRHAALVVPPPDDGRPLEHMQAYVLRLAEAAGELAVGRHWRLELRDGAVAEAALESEIDLLVRRPPPGQLLGLVHTGSPAPSPAHVFMSLVSGWRLEIATPSSGGRWSVDGEQVSRSPDQIDP